MQIIFQYCLAILMVEGGKAKLVKTEPGEAGPLYMFETVAGAVFTLAKPPLNTADEAEIMERVREILGEEGLG